MIGTRGISLVELLVGMAIGLFILAGAGGMAVQQLAEHRRIVLETQTQQDLRAATDLIARELRKAGRWTTPEAGLWSEGRASRSNPYQPIRVVDGGRQIEFAYDEWAAGSDASRAFRLQDEQLEFRLGGSGFQALTDPARLVVTALEFRLREHSRSLADGCPRPCISVPDCPSRQVRAVDLRIEAHARHDPRVRRDARLAIDLPADALQGACTP